MAEKLKYLANTFSGVTFYSQIKAVPDGDLVVIQMRDIKNDNRVHLKEAVRVHSPIPGRSPFVSPGDIIFRSRGLSYTAAMLDSKFDEKIIVASPLILVRPNTDVILPEYLLWWINQPSSQHYFLSISHGTNLKMVGKRDLEDLDVNVPSMEIQSEVVKLFRLSSREQHLLETIKGLKARYTQGVLMRMVKE